MEQSKDFNHTTTQLNAALSKLTESGEALVKMLFKLQAAKREIESTVDAPKQ